MVACASVLRATGSDSQAATIEGRASPLIEVDGPRFKDLNKYKGVDPYEDWRLRFYQPVSASPGQMTLEEKVGMMLIDTLNAGRGG